MALLLLIPFVLVLLMFAGWCGMACMHWLAVRYVPPREPGTG